MPSASSAASRSRSYSAIGSTAKAGLPPASRMICAGSVIDASSGSNLDHDQDKHAVVEVIDDPPVANAQAVSVPPLQLLHVSGLGRIVGHLPDLLPDQFRDITGYPTQGLKGGSRVSDRVHG